MAAAAIGPLVGDLPAWLAIPLMIVGGALAGAAWVLTPALLRVRLGIDEVVTTLLLNPVALLLVDALLHGPWRDPKTGFPQSPHIAPSATFFDLVPKSRLHLGFLVALAVLAVSWFVMTRTAAGLRMRAVGLNPHAARFAGMSVERTLLRVALASGAIAGLAGVSQVAGINHQLTGGVASGLGYTGIVVAMLGGLTMPGVLLAGLFIARPDGRRKFSVAQPGRAVADGSRAAGRPAPCHGGAAGGTAAPHRTRRRAARRGAPGRG